MVQLEQIIEISKKAGEAILEVYNSADFDVETKDDNSPLTKADKLSHEIITKELKSIHPFIHSSMQPIPLLSEEGKEIPYEERKDWERFWLVDPLDGTKEFIKRNGEFTVNIALIENGKPVLGVIHVPVTNETYYGSVEEGAYKIDSNGEVNKISVSDKNFDEEINVVQSRSHSGDEENEFYSNYKIKKRLSKGSSLKICLIAEGKAELYFRGGPTWEWDTAAGHAIMNAAGGILMNKDKSELTYNKKIPKNSGFIAASKSL